MSVQRYERMNFYDLPVHCIVCGQLVLSDDIDDMVSNPCRHTLYMAHDEGFTFVSDRFEQALTARSCVVIRHDADDIEIEFTNEDDDCSIDELTDSLEFPDALKVASYPGPPVVSGFYVSFAPTGYDEVE